MASLGWHPPAPSPFLPGLGTIIHYLLQGQLGCFWLTVACLAPGCVPQLLSTLWFKADGRPPGCGLLILHILQLGLWKR